MVFFSRLSHLPRCPREVWERGGERVKSLSVTSQFTVKSRIDRAENTWRLGWEMDIQRFIVNDIAKKQNKTKQNKK